MAEGRTEIWRTKDDHTWRIGGDAEVAWIADGTTRGRGITAALPPVFEAYATLELPGTPDARGGWSRDAGDHDEQQIQDATLISVLRGHTPPQDWWLGYLETGIDAETIFYDVPQAKLYADWGYVLVAAGPDQAQRWRTDGWKGPLPDLIFPADRRWLVSTLWDDYWRCIGGPADLIGALRDDPHLRHRIREVTVTSDDVTPPGHTAL